MPVPGSDVYIVDDPVGGSAPITTDTLFLLSPDAPDTPTVQRAANTGEAVLDAQLRAYFADGGRSCVIQGYGADPRPSLEEAIALLPPDAGQVVAPEAVTSANLITIADGAWANNKVALLNGPPGAADSALVTLAGLVVAGADGRGAGLWADTAQYQGLTPSDVDDVPFTITVAALIAHNDRVTHNPNLAAAGKRGGSIALGVSAGVRTDASRTTLNLAQVNTAKIVNNGVRNYGFRTLVDLDTLPQWWDLSGSRTVMWFRSRAAQIDESVVFDQIDGQRVLLDRYEGALRSALKELYDLGALYGVTPDAAYTVDTSPSVNPPENIAEGEIAATVRLKVSPYAEHVVTTIVRRPITSSL